MDDLAGLEMCRRLRADPRTAQAHVTMVLESDDEDDRRRALRAGADDYVVGKLDRTRILARVLAVLSDGPDVQAAHIIELGRSEARRLGERCYSRLRSRGAPY